MEEPIEIRVTAYRDLFDCVEEYSLDGDADQFPSIYETIYKSDCWGWIADHTNIHVWISEYATTEDKIKLFSHEFSHHLELPRYDRLSNVERLADLTSMCAVFGHLATRKYDEFIAANSEWEVADFAFRI